MIVNGRVWSHGYSRNGECGHKEGTFFPTYKRLDSLLHEHIIDIDCGEAFTVCLTGKNKPKFFSLYIF